ncbi:MAG: hypothetical protein OEZ57_01610, partial [Nitrospirota bacterium]|nr:hypothetical protein [Nitrospirota bacterium]
SGQTVVADFFEGLTKFSILAGKKASTPSLIYGGEHVQTREKITVYPWKNIQALSPILAPSAAK